MKISRIILEIFIVLVLIIVSLITGEQISGIFCFSYLPPSSHNFFCEGRMSILSDIFTLIVVFFVGFLFSYKRVVHWISFLISIFIAEAIIVFIVVAVSGVWFPDSSFFDFVFIGWVFPIDGILILPMIIGFILGYILLKKQERMSPRKEKE